MKPKLLILLMLCTPLLTACYRQTEEPFQQVDSAEVAIVATPTSIEAAVDLGGDTVSDDADASAETPREYVTPETVPGQVEQPTLERSTEISFAATSRSLTVTPFVRPTVPLLEEELDPNHECVYQVQSGDNLFRLSLSWGTTVQEIMDATQIEDDALYIGQLLLRPGCEYTAEPESPTEAPAPIVIEPEEPTAVPATDTVIIDAPTPGPRIHVVSSGETIESISLKYRVDVNELIALNNLSNPNRLTVGQELYLPDS